MTTAGGEVLYTSAKPAVNADAAAVSPLTQQPLLCTTGPNALLPHCVCVCSFVPTQAVYKAYSELSDDAFTGDTSQSFADLLAAGAKEAPSEVKKVAHTLSLSRSAASLSCPPLQASLLTAKYCGRGPLFRWCVTLFPSSLLDSLSTPTLPFPAKSTCAMTRTMLCVSRPSKWVLVLLHSP